MAQKKVVLTATFESILASQGINSLKAIITLRDDPKVSAVVRLKAAEAIIERIYGKASQHIEAKIDSTIDTKLTAAIDTLTIEQLIKMLSGDEE